MILVSSFFANISFLLLFLAMAFYWFDLAFFEKSPTLNPNSVRDLNFSVIPEIEPNTAYDSKQEKFSMNLDYGSAANKTASVAANLNNSSDINYGTSVQQTKTIFGEANSIFGYKKTSRFFIIGLISKYLIVLANLSLIMLLVVRWKESGHFPLSNLYESLMFLSWSCTSIHLFLITNATPEESKKNYKKSKSFFDGLGTNPSSNKLFIEKILGAVLAPSALFLNAFATFSLPKEMQLAGPLVPALQSNWLMMHVTVMILSYAALIIGSLLAIVYLIYVGLSSRNYGLEVRKLQNKTSKPAVENKESSATAPQALLLDYLSYRIIGIGFPFLTIGILSGAVWANEAWGSYWSWDPKETWALLTWLIFAIYLHTRLTKGWEGEKPALIASGGFIVVWICYLGVNLIGEGLHSYGFFK